MMPLATESATEFRAESATEFRAESDVGAYVRLSPETAKLTLPRRGAGRPAGASVELESFSLRGAFASVEPEYGELPFVKGRKEEEPTKAIWIPQLEGLDKHDPILTSTVRDMLHKLRAIVVSRAMQTRFPLRRTVVSVFRDPEEERSQALLRLFVDANAPQAIAFWDSLEKDLEDWLEGLDEHLRLRFLRDISLRVHWS